MSNGREAIYRPFPSFSEWQNVPVDLTTFDLFAERFASWKSTLTPSDLEHAVDVATRWASVDTGAIESLYDVDRSFTITVAASAAAWDNIHLAKGEAVERVVNDALAAYQYVLDAVTKRTPISQSWIRQVHEILCRSQDTYSVITTQGSREERPLVRGSYKTMPNNPFNLASGTVHAYAPVLDSQSEMQRMVDEFRSPAFLKAPPPVQAAYAHYAFVCIHPFADGNGRVSRALASVFLYRSTGVPLVIFADQKPAYIDALQAADDGHGDSFIAFVLDRCVDVMEMMRSTTKSGRDLRREIAGLQESTAVERRLEEQLSELGTRLLAEFVASLRSAVEVVGIEPPLVASIGRATGDVPRSTPQGFRGVATEFWVRFQADGESPLNATWTGDYFVAVAQTPGDGSRLAIHTAQGRTLLEAFPRDLTPAISTSLHFRLQQVSEGLMSQVFGDMISAFEGSRPAAWDDL